MSVLLQRLAGLRRRREQRALEALTVQAAQLRRAEDVAAEAATLVHRHRAAAAARERQLLAPLTGRTVPLTELMKVQLELDMAVLLSLRLQTAETQANTEVASQKSAHAQALAEYRQRQRAADKLDLACREEAARALLRQEAAGDAEAEDQSAAPAAGRFR